MTRALGDNKRDCIAKALANFEGQPFGELTLTNPATGASGTVDARKSYRREALRFLAMLEAARAWEEANPHG